MLYAKYPYVTVNPKEYVYIWPTDYWVHPETEVTITGEDMPWELKPLELSAGAMSSAEVKQRWKVSNA